MLSEGTLVSHMPSPKNKSRMHEQFMHPAFVLKVKIGYFLAAVFFAAFLAAGFYSVAGFFAAAFLTGAFLAGFSSTTTNSSRFSMSVRRDVTSFFRELISSA